MELGQRLRQARLEAGLSQKQLCGDAITRNMLSLIENGSARPSMDTLLYLAARLGKPVGYFLDEGGGLTENQALLLEARSAPPEQALKLFEEGAGLIASCNKMLDDAEQMVVKLKKGPDGYPIELPFEGVE